MNIYIMVDAEGISGIYADAQVSPDGDRYHECRELMVMDINACVEACKEAGVDKVYVRDAHHSGSNVVWKDLSDLADYYILGSTGFDRFAGLEDCDGVILLGYHALAGTADAILEHSMSASIQNYWMNGLKVGEIGMDAGLVGDAGKPVIMASGDDKLCEEVHALLPWAVTAEVKKGITWRGGMMLPAKKAHELIKSKTKEAIANFSRMKPLIFDKPVKLRVECAERHLPLTLKAQPYVTIIDGRTYEVEADTVQEAIFRA